MLTLKSDLPDGIRLNYYSSLCRIKARWIHEDKLIIPLTPLKYMLDSREGWGELPLKYKNILKSIVIFMNSVEIDGGYIECPICAIKTIFDLESLKNDYPSLKDLQNTFSLYLKNLKSTAIRSFFLTDTIENAMNSRYMWTLYGEMGKQNPSECDKPVLLSFNWHTLKSSFQSSSLELEAGIVNYLNSDDVLYYKDRSYEHEREFRIAIKSLEKGSQILLDDNAEIIAFMLDFNRAEEKFFESLGFSSTNAEAPRRLIKSELDQEAGHPNISSIENALKLLDSLDSDRWNQIMR